MNNANESAYPMPLVFNPNWGDSGQVENAAEHGFFGLTKRELAAIHLRIPDSGDPDIDAMIRKARHLDATERCMVALVNSITFPQECEDQLHKAGWKTEDFEKFAVEVGKGFADALLAALAKGGSDE